eukprot:62958-Chlamydomonas_euryale.AAC.5
MYVHTACKHACMQASIELAAVHSAQFAAWAWVDRAAGVATSCARRRWLGTASLAAGEVLHGVGLHARVGSIRVHVHALFSTHLYTCLRSPYFVAAKHMYIIKAATMCRPSLPSLLPPTPVMLGYTHSPVRPTFA